MFFRKEGPGRYRPCREKAAAPPRKGGGWGEWIGIIVLFLIPLGITLDERIADGYYYSGTVALVRELLAHPELLELPADTPVEYAIRR